MILDVITDPNLILHKVAALISAADLKSGKHKKLIADMTDTMYKKDGVGIAAVQVDVSYQICIIAKEHTPDKKKDLVLVNPVWKKTSLKTAWDAEGCLSVPGIFGEVKRYKQITVEALNENGDIIKFKAKDFFARIVQHEVDNLNGHLFIEKAKNLHESDRQAI